MSALLDSKKPYSTLHDSVTATVAEAVVLTCARGVTGGREFFLGESATSHLSAARVNSSSKLDSMISEEVNKYQMLLQYSRQALRLFGDTAMLSETPISLPGHIDISVSIVGLTIMVTLFVHELKYYLTTYTVHQMSVDLKRGDTLPIHINMTFPALPCEVLSVDAIDMSGKHEVDLDTNIWKLRLNREGHIIGTEYLSDLVEKEHSTHEHDHGDDHHEDSSQKKQEHTFNSDAEKMIKNVKHAMANSEGCRVYGVLDVQRVAGNFHLSVHGLNIFVAQQIFEGSSHVNVSHIIHDLSFGPKYPGIHNPLDGTTRILHDASGTFKYYIKIVPTEYRYLSKEVLPTNQFSVTEYFLPIRETDRSWPAVYFLYDLSPITVTIREERRSFLHFITRLCAVLGGTFALTGMLDRWMYIIIESVSKSKTRSVLR
ncbi:Endoplasmic reticulum-Golgi intermediate compartment protein 3 [Ananas comosus]|uniref:Endoplasmic reticulum-Golgi intermediate compartment protein 3 n=1 Tax=Ananas comosus TaxID=4615 RepID=A0A199V9G2_ANACO|nr:Endoplasmic reticulum-Golgi intermediate compartment protein 3 [Ananas comosus]